MLAAVAVPAYQGYQRDAAFSGMTADSTNISKAFLACTTVKSFANCDTLTELGMSLTGTSSDGRNAPEFCAQFTRDIGGLSYQQCVSADANSGATTVVNNQKTCYAHVTGTSCTAGVTSNPLLCTQGKPVTPCAASSDCSTAGVGAICPSTGAAGLCGPGTGKCT